MEAFFVMLLEQIDYDGNNTVGMVVQMGIWCRIKRLIKVIGFALQIKVSLLFKK